MLDRYQDMLDLPRPPSPSHAPMRRRDRAAQFAPFAALTGFDEQIRKVAWMQRSAFPYEGEGGTAKPCRMRCDTCVYAPQSTSSVASGDSFPS